MINKQVPKTLTVAEFLADRIATIDKTQREIAEACGFDNPNIITMFKNGSTKLLITRIAPLAKALQVDPAHLLRLVMLEYMPDTWETIENIMQSTVLTSNELELVRAFREVTGQNDAVPVVINRDAVIATWRRKGGTMSKNPQNDYEPFPPEERRSSRFFIEDPDLGWIAIGRNRWSAIHKGELRVPKWAGKTLRSAWASVEIDGRRVVALNRVSISTLKIKDDGFVDQDDQFQQQRKSVDMNARGEKQTDSIPTNGGR